MTERKNTQILNDGASNTVEREILTAREICELIDQKNYRSLTDRVAHMHSADIAEAVSELDKRQGLLLFRLLPKETSAEVFSYMESDMQKSIISSFTDSELAVILEELFVDDITGSAGDKDLFHNTFSRLYQSNLPLVERTPEMRGS